VDPNVWPIPSFQLDRSFIWWGVFFSASFFCFLWGDCRPFVFSLASDGAFSLLFFVIIADSFRAYVAFFGEKTGSQMVPLLSFSPSLFLFSCAFDSEEIYAIPRI